MKKIVVTGGLGFIGSNLIDLLLKKKYFVINIYKITYSSNFYNTKEFKKSKNYKFIKCDIKNKKIYNVFLKYKPAFIIISQRLESRAENFFGLLEQNYFFMSNLLDLVEKKQNCILKIIKSLALNSLFVKGVQIFLKDENNNLDTTVRYLDKYLKDIEDFGVFVGIVKR